MNLMRTVHFIYFVSLGTGHNLAGRGVGVGRYNSKF
jgi:hypothetical protein